MRGTARRPARRQRARQVEEDAASGSRSLRRALDILELMLAKGEAVSVADIVASLTIPKSTAYELVRTLTEGGYVERARKPGALFLGRKLFELGMAYRSNIDLLRDGSLIVEELCHQVGETVQLSVMENDLMLVLVKEEGSQPIRIISRIGSRVPVNWAAAGRLLVSDLDDGALRALLQRTIRPSPTGQAETDVDKLIAQIRRFRRQGYGIEINEANAHAGCIAAPVIDAAGHCVAAISIVAPEQRLGRPEREGLITQVRDAARRLSQRLGHS
jgi:IclR family KDG regulon transcriptional repressor